MPTYRFENRDTNALHLIEAETCEQAQELFFDATNILTRGRWEVIHPLTRAPILAKRACNKALDAFWNAVAESFPEITSGDMDPVEAVHFDEAAQRAVEAWLDANL